MAHKNVHRLAYLLSLLAVVSATKDENRWSRQLSTFTADIGDWVPLSSPVEQEPDFTLPQNKRQAVAEPRILTEPFPSVSRPTNFNADAYSSKNYFNTQPNRQQLYLQSVPSVPSASQNFLSDQGFGQNFRFGLSQPNFALSQGFVAQPFSYENVPPPPNPARPQGIPLNPVSFPQNSGAPLSIKAKPFLNPPQNTKPSIPKYVDGYRAENGSSEYALVPKKKPQSLQKIKFESGERLKPEITHHNAKTERGEEVQLLYVPLEQLNRGQFNFRSPLTSPQLVNTELFSQGLPRPNSGKQSFNNEYQRPPVNPIDNFSDQNYFSDFNTQLKDVDQAPKYTTPATSYATFGPTTPRSKKLKPHQPPLAIFTLTDPTKNKPIKVGDVLSSLKNAETIAVLDSVNPLNAPKVFIGPSNLPPPENYVKFDLPYLSNIDHSDNKLKQLPFFVAPLSYNTPNGFAKIPFPSPHVGSVVINSQIKDSSQNRLNSQPNQPNNNQNYYSATYKTETRPTTQKTTFSYYTTAAPKTKPTPDSNYYSFEPQTVSSIRPLQQPDTQTVPPKKASYFLSNSAPQYNSQEFANFPRDSFKPSEPVQKYNFGRQPERTATIRTTTTTTTNRPSTYPSQLLETHNPYSINHAFHFSTPLDYHSYFDDVKQPQGTPSSVRPQSPTPSSTPMPPKPKLGPEPVITEKPKYHQQSSPSYLNNYTPEIHYESDQNLKYPVFNQNDYVAKTELTSEQTQPDQPIDNTAAEKYKTDINTYTVNQYNNGDSSTYNYNSDYNKYSTNKNNPNNKYNTDDDSIDNQYNADINTSVESYKTEHNKESNTASSVKENPSEINNLPSLTGSDTPTSYDEYESYEPTLDTANVKPSTSTTTTTTTRRTPIRTRGRPRYTTTPRSDSYDSTRVASTRRPQRRPTSNRPRYEPNKISTENSGRKPLDSTESATNAPRTRTRGRVQYKPSDNEDQYENRKTHKKEEDLAYQRDVLHQNYPVTLTERNVDFAITEPTHRQVSSIAQEPVTETVDTENAYTNERASISNHGEVKDASALPTYTARSTLQTESPYVPNLKSTRNEEYYYQSRSSLATPEPSPYDEGLNEKDEDIYVKHTTPIPKAVVTESVYATESAETEQNLPNYSNYNDYTTTKQDELTTTLVTESSRAVSEEIHANEEEENVVQTTPSYNRVRVRPGVIRQYHQTTSTESSRPKERRRPSQPVTYRPAIDRRRTTMRIDEIEADLKTKQIHVRPDQEYRHPVYKPEPTTEPSVPPSSSTESTTKRNQFRRRKPSYTTTTTEASTTKRTYETKNRFRGRRTTTEKPTEKPETSTRVTSSTRTSLRARYSQRPRLSERFNKKAEPKAEVEDQDSNYSINRPRYVERSEQWSPKISIDSFKPYNPNDIADEYRIATTERRSDKETELDIITARNEYEDILLTVTPASNNRMNKKIPEIPPTLEALVEQSKITKSHTRDSMSTFESMLEEVMKSLEEQDQDEYSSNVMKHKGGEIGEIPPERIISSGDNYAPKTTTLSEDIPTEKTTVDDSPIMDEEDHSLKSRRRGFWKKVKKVRPATTESIEFAESQYYTNTVNHLGQPINMKTVHEKSSKSEKPKVTTYKPHLQFLTDLFPSADDIVHDDVVPKPDIFKINNKDKFVSEESLFSDESKQTTVYVGKEPQTIRPWDLDLGTGSPDPTIDELYFTTPTEPTSSKASDRVDTFSFLDYLFGATAEDSEKFTGSEKNITKATESGMQTSTEQAISKAITTESAFMPEEITESSVSEESTDIPEFLDITKLNIAEETKRETHNISTINSNVNVETSSVSSFMDPLNILSTSMSTEISHETEICFRGKCIKTNKDIL